MLNATLKILVLQFDSPSKKAEQILAFWASCAFQHATDQFIGPCGPLVWLCVEILTFCMQLIKWISALEDYGWCAAKAVPALAHEHINLMAGTLFSWTLNPLSSLGPLKIECCWDNSLSESPQVWFPEVSSPPVSLAVWMAPVQVCVDAVCWRKGLQLLTVPVLFISELSSEMCSNELLCLYFSHSPWWDTTCLWTLCIFTTSSTGPSQVLLCVVPISGCYLCTGGGTGGAVATCHHRHL